jgi:membrane protease YdiL (CAAX protease family)
MLAWRLMRWVWTIVALLLGGFVGLILACLIVGAPHAFPGLLMNAPDSVRDPVAMIAIALPAALAAWWAWRRTRS